MSRQTFFQGTLILVAAGLATKILGFVNRIVLSRVIGAEGIGLYQMAVPTLYLVITLSTFGLPIAISKMVAEAETKKDAAKVKNILRVSLAIVTVLSIVFTTLMIIGAPLISRYLLTDPRAYYSLISIAPIVPIVAVSSILRGYFQGRQNMIPTATSQMTEQAVRIVTVFVFATLLLPYGIEFAAAGAMIGIVIGELFGLLVLLYNFRKVNVKKVLGGRRQPVQAVKRAKKTFQEIIRIAVPVTTSRFIGSVTFALEPVIVAQSLALAGLTAALSTSLYGQLAGMAIPLLTFPTFFTYSLSVSLVPAIAEVSAKKNRQMIRRRIYQSLRIALIIGAPCTVLFYVFADPLGSFIYGNENVGRMLKIMAPLFLFLYFQGPLAAVLQGLDHAGAAMKNSVFGAIIKSIAIFALASQPQLGIDGVAMAINMGVVVVTLLHFFSVVKLVGFALDLKDFAKVGVIMVIMSLFASHTYQFLIDHHFEPLVSLITSITAASVCYILLLVVARVLGQQDIARIPWVGGYFAPFFPRR